MIKQDIVSVFQALGHIRPGVRVLDVVGPVKILQIQVPRVPHSHALGLQNKTLALGVHNIEGGLLVIKAVRRKRTVNSVINILDIQGAQHRPIPLNRALDGVGPGTQVVQIGLGDGQAAHRPAGGEIQILLGEGLPGVGQALRRS